VRLREYEIDYQGIAILLFQFLLVRLRGAQKDWREILTQISIPSGAIKSIQAHYFYLLRSNHFNSFWCD